MPRDPARVCLAPLFWAGICVLSGLAGCDQDRNPPVAQTMPAIEPDGRQKDSRQKDGRDKNNSGEPGDHDPASHRPFDADSSNEHSSGSPLPASSPVPVFRPDDRRSRQDDSRLAEAGIRLFESRRIKLYTDIAPDVAKALPGLIDELYLAWEEYFGSLPPDRAGTDYQVSGYLMRDTALFREFGLVPEEITFEHGCQRANEFWMREQDFDYFREHLLIHEATHCFMTAMPQVVAPNWYLEGMAEYFGTHRIRADKSTSFQVMPTSPDEFAGFGRISIIRKDYAANRALAIPAILELPVAEFTTPVPYAWSWALCAFLDGTPRYRERFRELGAMMQGNQFPAAFAERFDRDQRELATEWTLFVVNLQYGYDIPRAAIEFKPGTDLNDERPQQNLDIAANRGWQSSGVTIVAGQTCEISATGQFTLAEEPKPWVSESDGITFRYFDGRPLGKLVGCMRTEEGPAGGTDDPMLGIIDIGNKRSFVAPVTGTLYLRLNDAWNSLHDNRGSANVTIRRHLNINE